MYDPDAPIFRDECPELESLALVLEDNAAQRDEDPEGVLHGFPVEVWPCNWLVEAGRRWDDGVPILVECGAPTSPINGGAGWACSAGHRHEGLVAELEPFGLAWQREQAERAAEAA